MLPARAWWLLSNWASSFCVAARAVARRHDRRDAVALVVERVRVARVRHVTVEAGHASLGMAARPPVLDDAGGAFPVTVDAVLRFRDAQNGARVAPGRGGEGEEGERRRREGRRCADESHGDLRKGDGTCAVMVRPRPARGGPGSGATILWLRLSGSAMAQKPPLQPVRAEPAER